jgi:hypothetical protein
MPFTFLLCEDIEGVEFQPINLEPSVFSVSTMCRAPIVGRFATPAHTSACRMGFLSSFTTTPRIRPWGIACSVVWAWISGTERLRRVEATHVILKETSPIRWIRSLTERQSSDSLLRRRLSVIEDHAVPIPRAEALRYISLHCFRRTRISATVRRTGLCPYSMVLVVRPKRHSCAAKRYG